MLTNIESILSAKVTKTYSWVMFMLSFMCIGVNILHVIMFCANDDTLAIELTLTKTKIFCLTDGIWSGTLGLTVGFICNIIWFEKTDDDMERGVKFAGDGQKRKERIFRLEAMLFLACCLVTVLTLVGVYLSGYTIMYETLYFKRLTFAAIFCHWVFCIQTLLTLILSLATFSLAIFSFNVLLPLFYVELARMAWSKVFGKKEQNEWRGNMSFSGSSVQFGTIQTLSDTSIASLKRRLTDLREKENGNIVRSCDATECSSLTSGSSRHSRQDLIVF